MEDVAVEINADYEDDIVELMTELYFLMSTEDRVKFKNNTK